MAEILDVITVGQKLIYDVDSDPSTGGGTAAPVGTQAVLETGGAVGEMYIKIGAPDTAWDKVSTATSGGVGQGVARRLALYPANGFQVDDQVSLNSQDVDVQVVDQPTRTAGLTYNIPNPGDAITSADFVLTEGAQTINGEKTFEDNLTINADFTVNGTLTTVNTTELEVTDPLITINKGGAAASGGGTGIEIEENSVITGFIKQNAGRTGYSIKSSATAGEADLITPTANQAYTMPDEDGRLVLQSTGINGVVQQIPYWGTDESLANATGIGIDALTWDSGNSRLGIGTTAPSQAVDVSGNLRTNGNLMIQGNADMTTRQAVFQTTDGVNSVADSITIPTDTTVMIHTFINGRKSAGTGSGSVGDACGYVRTALFKNVGGTVTRLRDQASFTAEDVNAWRARVVANGLNADIEVRGSANDTLDWEITSFIQVLD